MVRQSIDTYGPFRRRSMVLLRYALRPDKAGLADNEQRLLSFLAIQTSTTNQRSNSQSTRAMKLIATMTGIVVYSGLFE